MEALQRAIEAAWAERHELTGASGGEAREAVDAVLDALDRGTLRVAEPGAGGWRVHGWVKQAVLLSFRLAPNTVMQAGGAPAYDKVALKFADWDEAAFAAAGIRVVPGTVVRRSAYVAPGAVLMPCFVNVGAHIGARSMIDTWATIGSCAQIGADCHISGGAGIGGVLEPLQAAPVIIEDNCFVGARSEVAEGVIVEQGSVLAMGVFLGASTKILDRATGTITRGRVPAYSVVVPGVHDGLACAVIVKRVDAQTRAKTAINELLRD